MNTATKVVMGVGGIGLLALAVSKLWKESKKEVQEEVAKEKEILKTAGLNPEKVYDLSGKDNFVKNLFLNLLKNTEENIWDEVLTTTDFELHDQSLWGSIRVIKRNEDTVSFLVQIPPYNKGEFDTLSNYKERIVEGVKSCLDSTHVQWKWFYRGFYEHFDDNCRTETGKRKLIVSEITESDTSSFSDRGYSDGLARLVSYYYENDAKNLKKDPNMLSVGMFIELQFNVKKHDSDMYGIDLLQAVDVLKKLMFDVNIMERVEEEGDCFPEIVFFPEMNDFTTYYETEESEGGVLCKYSLQTIVESSEE